MGIERPYLVVGVQAGKGLDSDMHDVRYLDGAALACDVKDDWYDFRAEHGRYQRCPRTQSAASSASEACHKGAALALIFPLIEVIYDTPVSFAHGSGRMCDHRNIKAIERYVAVTATIDVEGKGGLAVSFRRPGGQRRVWRKGAKAPYLAVAVLEILSCYTPVPLRRSHLYL